MQELEKILNEIDERIEYAKKAYIINEDLEVYLMYKKTPEESKAIIRKHTNDGWVSVEERLPEYGKKVLSYGKSGEIDIASLYSRDKHMWLVGSMCSVAFGIIAWRPLPEPYSPERSDNNDGE